MGRVGEEAVESKGRMKKAKAYSIHLFSCDECDFDSATSYPTIESAKRAAFAHNREVHGERCPRSPMHSKSGGDCWLCCPETE